MRILMFSDVYFPRVNGVSTSIQTFAREFVAKGHEVTLIAPDYGKVAPDASKAAPEPFEIIRIPSRDLPVDPEDRILRLGQLRRWRGTLAARGYDLLHIHTPFLAHYAGLGLARRLGVPVVESYHTFFEQYLDNYVSFVPRAWLRFAARRFSAAQCNAVDALVVPSRAMLEVLRGYGVRTAASVIPTGIEIDQFSHGDRGRFRARHGIAPGRPVLVHVGRIAHEKNIDFLLQVLVRVRRSLPSVLLVIAGEGPARPGLERLAQRLGVAGNLLFLGYLDRNGPLEDCYRAGDAFVFASRTETQGLVLLEAMALGVPVVALAIMGTKEVLGAGRGSLIAEDDEADFAAKVLRILGDRSLRRRLAAEARVYAATWAASVQADRMLALYETQVLPRRDYRACRDRHRWRPRSQ